MLALYRLSDQGKLHPMRERRYRALSASVDYIESHMPEAIGFETGRRLLEFSLQQTSVEGYFMEFGVYKGATIRHLAKLRPNTAFHGFDSFEGLPEAWGGFNLDKSAFDLGGRLPQAPANVSLHKGWFRESLPAWGVKNPGPVAFMHIDCDLYSSTMDILRALADRFQPGTVVVFDEYFNYPGWENHEFKAWHEFVKERGIQYEYIGFARQQAAMRITSA